MQSDQIRKKNSNRKNLSIYRGILKNFVIEIYDSDYKGCLLDNI